MKNWRGVPEGGLQRMGMFLNDGKLEWKEIFLEYGRQLDKWVLGEKHPIYQLRARPHLQAGRKMTSGSTLLGMGKITPSTVRHSLAIRKKPRKSQE